MSAKHTPGPWSYNYIGSHGYCIYAGATPGGKHIGLSILYKKDGGEANARVMAAAPDFIEPAERAIEMLTAYAELVKATGKYAEMHYIPEIEYVIGELRAAHAKATGSAS